MTSWSHSLWQNDETEPNFQQSDHNSCSVTVFKEAQMLLIQQIIFPTL